ncbi:MAG: hypothetical protein AAGC78_12745 [Cellvibrio sp.]
MLLLHQSPEQAWNIAVIAQRMYVSQSQVAVMLRELCDAGVCKSSSGVNDEFIYAPITSELAQLIDELSEFYPRNLIQVTNMIHAKSSSGQRVQMFADAFKLHKDK